MTQILISLVLTAGILSGFLYHGFITVQCCRRQIRDTARYCQASNARFYYQLQHPDLGYGDPHFQTMVQIELGAYLLWAESHPSQYQRLEVDRLLRRMEAQPQQEL